MIIENRDALLKEREAAQKEIDSYNCRILVCAGTGCIASGSEKIYQKLAESVSYTHLDVYKRQASPSVHSSHTERFSLLTAREIFFPTLNSGTAFA